MNPTHYAICLNSFDYLEKAFVNEPQSFLEPFGEDKNCTTALPLFHIFKSTALTLDKDFLISVIDYNLQQCKDRNAMVLDILKLYNNTLSGVEGVSSLLLVLLNHIQIKKFKYKKTNSKDLYHLLSFIDDIIYDYITQNILLNKNAAGKIIEIFDFISVQDILCYKSEDNQSTTSVYSTYVNIIERSFTTIGKNDIELKEFLLQKFTYATPQKKSVNLKDYGAVNDRYINETLLFDNYYNILFKKNKSLIDMNVQGNILLSRQLNEFNYRKKSLKYRQDEKIVDIFNNFITVFEDDFDFKGNIREYLNAFEVEFNKLKQLDPNAYQSLYGYEFSSSFLWIIDYNNGEFFEEFMDKYSDIIHKTIMQLHYNNEKSKLVVWPYLVSKNLINPWDIKISNAYEHTDSDILNQLYHEHLSFLEKNKILDNVKQENSFLDKKNNFKL